MSRKIWMTFIGLSAGLVAASLLPLVGLSGCGSSDKPDSTCEACAQQGKATYACYGGLFASQDKYLGTICDDPALTEHQALQACRDTYNAGFVGVKSVVLWPCNQYGHETGFETEGYNSHDWPLDCSSWDPSQHVVLDTNGPAPIRWVWEPFVASLVDTSSANLVFCDDARVEPQISGRYRVIDVAAGSLLYELGLEDGDEFVRVNGIALDTFGGAALALELYLEDDEWSYELVIDRGGTNVTLYYELDGPTL